MSFGKVIVEVVKLACMFCLGVCLYHIVTEPEVTTRMKFVIVGGINLVGFLILDGRK